MSTLKKAFKKSLYYIGAGFDWQPLLRMSHITQTFFYVNLFYTKEQVLRKLFGELNNHEDIELLSVKSQVFADGQLPEGLMPAYLEGFEKARGSMGLMEWHGYRMEFQHTLQEEKWMLEATLKLKHNGKTIRLIYLSAEGLAAYYALSDNGKTAPTVLCTIQTGILEWPNRLMTRFLEKLENKPDIWVRGYETDSYEANPYILTETDRLYPVKGCDFLLPWRVAATYLPFESDQGSPRRVKAFHTKEAHERILAMGFKDYKGNSILGDGLKSLTPGNVPSKSLVIATDRTVRLIPAGLHVKVETWENLFKKGKRGNPYRCRMKDCLDILRSIDAKGEYDCILFLPYGYEDEGHLLDAFLSENHRATMKAVVGSPLDLVDLKSGATGEWEINHTDWGLEFVNTRVKERMSSRNGKMGQPDIIKYHVENNATWTMTSFKGGDADEHAGSGALTSIEGTEDPMADIKKTTHMEDTGERILVIHPDDRSTDFLRGIYAGLPGVTLVTGGKTREELMEMMDAHDRVFLLGHGLGWGLLSVGKFPGNFLLVEEAFLPQLHRKAGTASLCIWCHANKFTTRNGLDMVATGMFVSERSECNHIEGHVTDDQIDESNEVFCSIVRSGIHLPQAELLEKIRIEYGRLAATNPVAAYNHGDMFREVVISRRA